jgi:hypothetical protein
MTADASRLITILRNLGSQPYRLGGPTADTMHEAADEIEKLRFALREMIDSSAAYHGNPGFDNVRAAAKALIGDDA